VALEPAVRRALLLVAAAAVLAAGCGGSHRSAKTTAPPVRTLHSVAELRTLFNAQPGIPRLIVLVSPT
jgi:hypothetical protein